MNIKTLTPMKAVTRFLGGAAVFSLLLAGCGESHEPITPAEFPPVYSSLIRRVGGLLTGPGQFDQEREYLIRDLGDTRDPAALPYLLRIFKEGNASERYQAAEAMAKIGDPQTLDVLKEAIKTGRLSEVQGTICLGVLAVSGENAEALDEVLQAARNAPDVNVRLYAISGLRPVHPKHAKTRAALESVVTHDPSQRVRARAACVLVAHGEKRYWAVVENAAKNNDPTVREDVAFCVPFEEEAMPILLELLGDENQQAAMAAWERLEKNLDAPGSQSPAADPYDIEKQREIYRKAWMKYKHKNE